MKKDKLRFRVLVDQLGMTPDLIAKALEKKESTKSSHIHLRNAVGRWMNFNSSYRYPSPAAWDILGEARKRQLQEIDTIISQAIESRDKKGVTTVRLPYYTSQEDYDTLYDDGYDWHMTNATLRLAGERLRGLGFGIEFVFADEILQDDDKTPGKNT